MDREGVYKVQRYADNGWLFALYENGYFYLFGDEKQYEKSDFQKIGEYVSKYVEGDE